MLLFPKNITRKIMPKEFLGDHLFLMFPSSEIDTFHVDCSTFLKNAIIKYAPYFIFRELYIDYVSERK